VIRPVARAAAGLVVAPFLLLASALAPTHVHEPGPAHDHDHAVVHSHFAPHVETHGHGDPGDIDQLEIEQDGTSHGHVVWLDSSILHQSPYQPDQVPAAIPVGYETVQVEMYWSVTPFDDAAPVHGPPKPDPLFRGPPPSLA
jgi:hypothetical protein